MTLEEESGRGSSARAILESPLFKEAVEKVQQDIYDKFAQTDPANVDELRIQRIRQKCLADIVRQLGEVMTSGKLAEVQIERSRTLMERTKERLSRGLRRVF